MQQRISAAPGPVFTVSTGYVRFLQRPHVSQPSMSTSGHLATSRVSWPRLHFDVLACEKEAERWRTEIFFEQIALHLQDSNFWVEGRRPVCLGLGLRVPDEVKVADVVYRCFCVAASGRVCMHASLRAWDDAKNPTLSWSCTLVRVCSVGGS